MKHFLPVTLRNLPQNFIFQPDGRLRGNFKHAVQQGCVRVIAGAVKRHVVIDIKRPYIRAQMDAYYEN